MVTRLAFLVIFAMHHRKQRRVYESVLECLFDRPQRVSNVCFID